MAFVPVESIAARALYNRRVATSGSCYASATLVYRRPNRLREGSTASDKPDARGNLNPVIARCMSTLLVFGFGFAFASL